jgi:hypothetical protein
MSGMSRERLPIATDAEDRAIASREASERRARHDTVQMDSGEKKKKGMMDPMDMMGGMMGGE